MCAMCQYFEEIFTDFHYSVEMAWHAPLNGPIWSEEHVTLSTERLDGDFIVVHLSLIFYIL